ncbi:1-acyl-sn-glycerol-3-phosphate acyltransferase [Microlunatus sp. Gsoil 973]|uniref:lysophospholipid acyltransferase family protein n=1 Tax=Microlunatus sp. Gsoil 973 TaxID=2672569 RepID=UPI0012B4C692|nr:lysophospholipid acyltransferase family protein [Microlunatus sp. Gsoil 973]QGN33090.1 1-acyl-sn-glycerol-3-phosphate acyltransferase [Microlunatus sp. Gsoil 973]
MDLTPVAKLLRPAAWLVISVINLLVRPDWRNAEKLPHGPAIIVVNHISNVDPPLVGAFLARHGLWPRFLAKDSLFAVPILGRILTGIAQIPVQRGTATAGDALEHAVTAIEQGGCVVIYPEGTITTDTGLWPMRAKTGAARLAARTGVPVIPIGQWGAERILYGKRIGIPAFLPRKQISMLVGDPIETDGLSPEQATRRIMTVITGLVAQLRGEIPPVAYDPDK